MPSEIMYRDEENANNEINKKNETDLLLLCVSRYEKCKLRWKKGSLNVDSGDEPLHQNKHQNQNQDQQVRVPHGVQESSPLVTVLKEINHLCDGFVKVL
ncbi:hypothetical protein EYF80_047540 [Liparis tanakae]|uniref:Uncharacterized protein n=1 Tax=Liparis tanakae TaxID=230148 RepID=A0A4Z2FPP9_9TELE|nr:hypothetical protein EYF80_047540 [Liparis tanakae]